MASVFLNPERGQGDTRYLDLQFHTYSRKVVLDAFGQFYRGFYLAGTDITTDNSYYSASRFEGEPRRDLYAVYF